MYKVFYNNRYIILCDRKSNFHSQFPKYSYLIQKPEDLKYIINMFLKKSDQFMFIIYKDIEELFSEFKKLFTYIEAAGGLVSDKDNKILFIYKNNRYDLPKGKFMEDETPEECAIREVTEESGLDEVSISNKITDTYHIYHTNNQSVLKKTYWYAMKHNGNGEVSPEKNENITMALWIDEGQLDTIFHNTYLSIVDVVKQRIPRSE